MRQLEKKSNEGILIAADISQEWLLSWWWENYHKHNSHPVCLIDLGISPSAKTWCSSKNIQIQKIPTIFFAKEKHEIDPALAAAWETSTGNTFWSSRDAWFQKPFACLHSPFQKTLWLDLDCQVLKSLTPLFVLFQKKNFFGIVPEILDSPRSTAYNTGLLAFTQSHPLLQLWSQTTLTSTHLFRGDQDILEHLIQTTPITKLPLLYNWSRRYPPNQQAAILHWHGHPGKQAIKHQLADLQLKNLTIN